MSVGLGPGVYDIHSPRVPGVDELAGLLRRALSVLPARPVVGQPRLRVEDPRADEVTEALGNLVEAARRVRAELVTP